MQPFCHFKRNNLILKTKPAPSDNYDQFSSKAVLNKCGLPNLAKLIQGDVRFFTYRKHTYTLRIFIYLQANSPIIFLASFQSFNRFLNTLCRNECYWRLKRCTDFLATPGNISDVSYLQNAIRAVFKRKQDQEEIGYSLTVL